MVVIGSLQGLVHVAQRERYLLRSSPPAAQHNRAQVRRRSCGASSSMAAFAANSRTTCQTTFSGHALTPDPPRSISGGIGRSPKSRCEQIFRDAFSRLLFETMIQSRVNREILGIVAKPVEPNGAQETPLYPVHSYFVEGKHADTNPQKGDTTKEARTPRGYPRGFRAAFYRTARRPRQGKTEIDEDDSSD